MGEEKKPVKVVVKVKPKETTEQPVQEAPKEPPKKSSKGTVKTILFFSLLGVLVALLIIMGISIYDQKKQEAEPPVEATQSDVVETTTESPDDAKLFTVTLPADYFGDQTPEQIQEEAEAAGFESCTVNEDGSVTYTMSNSKRKQLLRAYKKQIDPTIEQMTSGGEDAPLSFKKITYNKDLTEFQVYVDRSQYENNQTDSMYILGLYLLGAYYQMLDGVPEDQIDIQVNVIDQSNEEVLDTGSYQEAQANMAQYS